MVEPVYNTLNNNDTTQYQKCTSIMRMYLTKSRTATLTMYQTIQTKATEYFTLPAYNSIKNITHQEDPNFTQQD